MTDDLCTAPGADDLTFGSLLDEMLRLCFSPSTLASERNKHRFYIECKFCKGSDIDRPRNTMAHMNRVQHADDCLLAKHMLRLKAMAAKGIFT